MRNSEKKPMTRTKKIILTVVIVLLVLVLSALIAGIVIYNRLLNNLNRFEDPTVMTAPVDATQSTEETVPPTTLDPYDFDTMFPGEERMKIYFEDTKKLVTAPCLIHSALVEELTEKLGAENVVVK